MPLKKNWNGTPGERFWRSVDRAGDGCWEWTAGKNSDGYGEIRIGREIVLAHRFSWWIYFGQPPAGMCVLHKCDNPACCNPSHLFLGTQADNMADKVKKGRHLSVRGEAHSSAKLSNSDVIAIRKRLATGGEFQKDIARAYGVSPQLISHIKTRRQWAHLQQEAN